MVPRGGSRPGAGRPRVGNDVAKDVVGLRLPPEILALIDKARASTGETRSQWIRNWIEEGIAEDLLEDRVLQEFMKNIYEGKVKIQLKSGGEPVVGKLLSFEVRSFVILETKADDLNQKKELIPWHSIDKISYV